MFRQPQGKKLSESSEELTSAKVVERLSLLIPTTALLRDNSIPTIRVHGQTYQMTLTRC